jgi:flagellar hook-basal body complex protein FliE
MAIPPIASLTGGVPATTVPPAQPGGTAPAGDFGSVLMQQMANLNQLQLTAADQSRALATGQATDVSAVVSSVEQAALAMQLAVQVRNKAVDAYQEIMRMQI